MESITSRIISFCSGASGLNCSASLTWSNATRVAGALSSDHSLTQPKLHA